MRRTAPGFTLVEIMIVLLLLGIVLASAVPSMTSSMNEIKLDAAARETVTAIQYVQSLAVKEGVLHGILYSPSIDQYRCYKNITSNTIRDPLDKKSYVIDFSEEGTLQGVDLVSAHFGEMTKLTFNSLGEPSSGGTIVLGYAGLQKTIDISTPLGRVTVQ